MSRVEISDPTVDNEQPAYVAAAGQHLSIILGQVPETGLITELRVITSLSTPALITLITRATLPCHVYKWHMSTALSPWRNQVNVSHAHVFPEVFLRKFCIYLLFPPFQPQSQSIVISCTLLSSNNNINFNGTGNIIFNFSIYENKQNILTLLCQNVQTFWQKNTRKVIR